MLLRGWGLFSLTIGIVNTCMLWYHLAALPQLDSLKHVVPNSHYSLGRSQDNAGEEVQEEVKGLTLSCTAGDSWSQAQLSGSKSAALFLSLCLFIF